MYQVIYVQDLGSNWIKVIRDNADDPFATYIHLGEGGRGDETVVNDLAELKKRAEQAWQNHVDDLFATGKAEVTGYPKEAFL